MGKPTGFMEYERETAKAESTLWKEFKHFDEFHTPLSQRKTARCRAARCMACGVPFCQSGMMIAGMASGCPLHNLVPEWNDLLYNGNVGSRLTSRLHKTTQFPGVYHPVSARHCVRRHAPAI